MLPTLKVYKIDYDFIISNYLDKSLWKKKWNLFVYKDNIFTINLYKIDMENDSIMLKIKYNKRSWDSEYVQYYIDGRINMSVFMKEINGAIFRLMYNYEQELIKKTPGYQKILDAYQEEKDMLKDIASRYLDSCGITNDDIREPYIDAYVSRNSHTDLQLSSYLGTYAYNYLSEMMMVYTKAIGDESRLSTIRNAIKNKLNLGIIEAEVDLYLDKMNTTDFIEEMEDCLESI